MYVYELFKFKSCCYFVPFLGRGDNFRSMRILCSCLPYHLSFLLANAFYRFGGGGVNTVYVTLCAKNSQPLKLSTYTYSPCLSAPRIVH